MRMTPNLVIDSLVEEKNCTNRKLIELEKFIQDYEKEALKQIQDLKFEIKNLEFENEFLKYKNSKYREEIWNHELKKV